MYLTDLSSNTSLIDRILGANTPEKRVNIGITFDLLTLIFSSVLLIFLFGYFDGRFARTGESAPPIIYLVYLFLGLVAIWQLLSLVIGLSYKNKLSGRKKEDTPTDAGINENPAQPEPTEQYLPPADTQNIVPPSVTEQTTRSLDKVRRK